MDPRHAVEQDAPPHITQVCSRVAWSRPSAVHTSPQRHACVLHAHAHASREARYLCGEISMKQHHPEPGHIDKNQSTRFKRDFQRLLVALLALGPPWCCHHSIVIPGIHVVFLRCHLPQQAPLLSLMVCLETRYIQMEWLVRCIHTSTIAILHRPMGGLCKML